MNPEEKEKANLLLGQLIAAELALQMALPSVFNQTDSPEGQLFIQLREVTDRISRAIGTYPQPLPVFPGLVSGRALCRHLVSLGVPVQKVVRKQESGDYVADFFVPEMQEPTLSAEEWAKRIQAALPSALILDTHNTHASWRPGNPVIYATVIFRLEEKDAQ